ncbi:acyl-CoA desaturase [Methyloversatilis sp.]|uniref:acyl-CoA desaturase n=1 Tax=Methyloversatilis sp. TaxID=2569862 RepID=UPI0027B994F5|nr:acyl-CoA desaturase [Methyloversatilis sp.]
MSATAPPRVRYGKQVTESINQTRVRYVILFGCAIATPFLFPPTWPLVLLAVASYALRMFGVEAIYHRYFSHRAFKCSRPVQFVLAVIASQCGQHGPLWWASVHRVHHQNVEQPDDPISPRQHGLMQSHVGWVWCERYKDTDLDVVPDFARFPEILWVNKHYTLLMLSGAFFIWLLATAGAFGPTVTGGAALMWGFFLPTALGVQTVSLVNSIGHFGHLPGGYRRFETDDDSVNRPLLALLTMGGGWHNNHHRYGASARAGFAWYEIDLTYYLLKLLAMLGIIRDLRDQLPDDVRVEGGLAPAASKVGDLR